MRLALALARAMLAAIAVTFVAMWEGGRIVWKTVRAIMASTSQAAEALAEQQAELAHPKPDATQRPISPEMWGRAALAFLSEGDVPEAKCLDGAARHYLRGLTVDQIDELALHTDFGIGRHLLGEQTILALPKPMSPVDWMNAETDKLVASTAELAATVEASRRQREQNEVTGRILDFLCDPNAPSWKPRKA